uniref:Uncharacterized protein n=1 Tax=Rhizophora mucronata TaxID=61149 RepID=A0A2P2NZE7_RHIMU
MLASNTQTITLCHMFSSCVLIGSHVIGLSPTCTPVSYDVVVNFWHIYLCITGLILNLHSNIS